MPRRGLSLAVLIVNQLLAGVGVATGMALAAILTADLTGAVWMGGLAQSSSVLGAAIVAVPLARLAIRSGRHVALATGYALACVGAILVIVAASSGMAAARVPRPRGVRGGCRGRPAGAIRRDRGGRARLRGALDVARALGHDDRVRRRAAALADRRHGRAVARAAAARRPVRVLGGRLRGVVAARRHAAAHAEGGSPRDRRRVGARCRRRARAGRGIRLGRGIRPARRPAAGARRRPPPLLRSRRPRPRDASARGRRCASPCATRARSSRSSRSCARRPS